MKRRFVAEGALVAAALFYGVTFPLVHDARAGGDQTTRPTLVVVGWISYSLTVTLPILGVVLARLA